VNREAPFLGPRERAVWKSRRVLRLDGRLLHERLECRHLRDLVVQRSESRVVELVHDRHGHLLITFGGQYRMANIVQEENELAESLVYLASARGGDNYWARIVNGTDKVYDPNLGTCCVSVNINGNYTFTADLGWLRTQVVPMRKLIVIHEAGHIALRHLERIFRLLWSITDKATRYAIKSTFNIAADLAVNDSILRKEPEFRDLVKRGLFTGLLPERFNPALPKGLSMEGYITEILKRQEQIAQQLKQLAEMSGDMRGLPSFGDDSDDDGEGSGGGSSSEGKKKEEEQPGTGGQVANDEDPILPKGMGNSAKADPDRFEGMDEDFHKVTNNAHKQWNDCADKMTQEDANQTANEMKRHARRLVKSAHQQTILSRGTVPSDIQQLVESLTGPDQVPWHWLLDDLLATHISSRVVEEMVMPNIGLLNLDDVEPWPGTSLDFAFNITWMTDTSGSMADPEYARACNCMNGLMSIHKNIHLTYVECDAALQKEMVVDNISVPDEETAAKMKTRAGYGGTVYVPFFRRVLGLDETGDWRGERPKDPMTKPDLIVIVSDGGVNIIPECFPSLRPDCPIIWLITPNMSAVPGMENVSPDRVINMFEIKGEYE
jgi:predicted metal-dependent peptidase